MSRQVKQQFNVKLLPKTIARIKKFREDAQCYSNAEAVERAFCIALTVLDHELRGHVVRIDLNPDEPGSLVLSALDARGLWLNEERAADTSSD